MKRFSKSIKTVFKGSTNAFKRYPIVLINAIIFAVVTMLKIRLDISYYSDEDFWITCLQFATALSAFVSLASLSFLEKKDANKKNFVLVNILGVVITITTMSLLFYTAETNTNYMGDVYRTLSVITTVRVFAIISISLLLFTLFAENPEKEAAYSRSLFMTYKAFFTALVYGLIILAGASLVIFTFDNLIIDVDSEIYAHIGIVSGFIAFTIFVGYFPNFKKREVDERRKTTEEQGKFIRVLFEYILTPIFLALTIVLLLWALKTIVKGIDDDFEAISAIAFSYTYFGIWLHIMLTEYKSALANFFKKSYPVTALFILIFEAWALIHQLNQFGLRDSEYIFIVIWILALVSAILLLIKKEKAHHMIIGTTIALIIISVAPYINYEYIPYKVQINRLEKILISNNMLVNNMIIPTKIELDNDTKTNIRESVEYITWSDSNKPTWFIDNLSDYQVFKDTFGFEQNNYYFENYNEVNRSRTVKLEFKESMVNVKDYSWLIEIEETFKGYSDEKQLSFEGERGKYTIDWTRKRYNEIPNLKIALNNQIVFDGDINEFLESIDTKYPFTDKNVYTVKAPLEDMTYIMESDYLRVTLILKDLNIDENLTKNTKEYSIGPKYLLIEEFI